MHAKEISTYFAEVKFGNIFTAIPLKNESMNYWFVANGRRFIIVVKVEQYYLSMYCGFMLSIWDLDLENTYPMYIGGSHNNNYARIGDEDAGRPIHEINFDYGGFMTRSPKTIPLVHRGIQALVFAIPQMESWR